MFRFTDVITVNTRKVKKLVKKMSQQSGTGVHSKAQAYNSISESYRGRFVVVDVRDEGLICISHCPETPDLHQRVRNVPKSLAKRIKRNDHTIADKLTLKENKDV